MTPEAANTLVNLLTELWPKQAKELTPAMRSVWLRSFTAVDYKAVGDAIMALRVSRTWMPDPIDVLRVAVIEPTAQAIASEAVRAVGRFGTYRRADAEQALSAGAWEAVERFGGWTAWCQAPDDPRTAAQMARIADSVAASTVGIMGALASPDERRAIGDGHE